MTEPPPDEPDHPAGDARTPPRGCRYLLVGFGAVLFFIAPFSVVAVFLLTVSSGPDDGARDWLDAIRAQRYDAALGLMCPRYHDTMSGVDLRERITRAGGISRSRIGRTDTHSDTTATVTVRVTTAERVRRELRLSLVKSGDRWRVCSVP